MLEEPCHILDFKISVALTKETNNILDGNFAATFIESQTKIRDLEYLVADYHNKIDLVHEALGLQILKSPEKEREMQNIYRPRLEHLNQKLLEKVCKNYYQSNFLLLLFINFS